CRAVKYHESQQRNFSLECVFPGWTRKGSLKTCVLLQAGHSDISPRATSTAWPPTRTFTILSPARSALRKIRLRRFISTPCSSSDCSPEGITPYFTAQAAQGPAADPVAGSSPL